MDTKTGQYGQTKRRHPQFQSADAHIVVKYIFVFADVVFVQQGGSESQGGKIKQRFVQKIGNGMYLQMKGERKHTQHDRNRYTNLERTEEKYQV